MKTSILEDAEFRSVTYQGVYYRCHYKAVLHSPSEGRWAIVVTFGLKAVEHTRSFVDPPGHHVVLACVEQTYRMLRENRKRAKTGAKR